MYLLQGVVGEGVSPSYSSTILNRELSPWRIDSPEIINQGPHWNGILFSPGPSLTEPSSSFKLASLLFFFFLSKSIEYFGVDVGPDQDKVYFLCLEKKQMPPPSVAIMISILLTASL